MKHYHGLTRDEIIQNPSQPGACYRLADVTGGGTRKVYFCSPTPVEGSTKALRRSGKRTRYESGKPKRCVCGRLERHCQFKGRGICQCGDVNC